MNIKNYWAATLTAGLFTLAAAVWIGGQFPKDFAEPSADYRDPIIAFEFAESPDDLLAIFGPETDPDRAERQNRMDKGHDADRIFLVTYSLFIASFFLAYRHEHGQKLMMLGIILAVTAAFFDIWENAILREITHAIDDPHEVVMPMLATLHTATWIKWFALGIGSGLAAFTLYRDKRPILAVLALPGFFLSVPAFIDPRGYATLFADMIGLWFLVMLIAAGLNYRRASKANSG